MTRRRRFAFEALEPRLVLDSIGLGDVPHGGAEWQSVIVSLRDDVGNPRAVGQALMAQHGGQLGHVYEYALRGFSAQMPAAAVAALAKNPQVKLVEQDLVMEAFAQTLPTGVNRIDAELNTIGGTIGQSKQINVDIAIIDSGIDADHPDLNVIGGTRFYTITRGPSRGSYQDGNYDDEYGHGTHVAGIAAARDNDLGVVGVAPGASLWSVRVLDSSGNGYVSDIIKGIDWVTARADVIEVANMSLGGQGKSDAYRTAIQNSVNAGIVYLVAAGNSGADIHGSDKLFNTSDDFIPAAYPEVATISAFADSDGEPGWAGPDTSWGENGQDDYWWRLSNFSNSDANDGNVAFVEVNPVTSPGLGIDLVLPGVDILSTYPGGGYEWMSGTSMAAPHAAGLAALYITANGRATNAAGVAAIRQSLIDGGKAWDDPKYGIFSYYDGYYQGGTPDRYRENLGWAGPAVPSDAAPSVSIKDPIDGATVANNITITASAVDDNGVAKVEFFVDGASIGVDTDGSNGWSASWSTAATDANGQPLYPDGSHTINAVATDTASQTGSHSIVVSVDNVNDPPYVAITSPTDGAVLSGTVAITAEATDDRGVSHVEFFVDGAIIWTDVDGTDGWSISWDTLSYLDGSHVIKAKATDAGSVWVESNVVTVTVDNSIDTMTASLSGIPQIVNPNFWRAQVTAMVVDAAQIPLLGAAVTGRWNSDSSTVSGTTNAYGQVTFTSANLRNNVTSITFTVTDVVLAGYVYESGEISITINKSGTTSLSASLYDQLANWQTAEQTRAAKKDRHLAAETIDYLMTLEA